MYPFYRGGVQTRGAFLCHPVPEPPDQLALRVIRKLQETRRAKGITQEVLAERLGVSLNNVQRIEAGQNITFRTLSRIATALGVEIDVEFKDVGAGKAVPPTRKMQKGRHKRGV
jgi:transcriptional regulator with XRE-family HTH domain